MDCTCNCFGVATAARVPVKRYNLLVPDIYPVTEPPFNKPLGISIERKFKKLAEYLERNEHRAPKASRRLARRLYSDLHRQRYGYVRLTVEAYLHLLRENRPEKSALFANELVVRSVEKRRRDWLLGRKHQPALSSPLGSVVGRLLSHKTVGMRLLGVELLTEFTRQQSTSDYVAQLEGFVPLLCRYANPRLPFNGTPDGATPEALAALRAACLRGLLEHLRFCARASFVSHHLDSITYGVLDNIEHAELAAKPSDMSSVRAAAEERTDSMQAMRRLSIGARVGASPPDIAALLVFEQLSHITRDVAEGKKVLEFVMRYLDQGGRWLGSPVLETSLTVLRQAAQAEHQRYLLYSALMRHVAAAQLTPAERAAVLNLAVEEALTLEPGLAPPALLLALKELPAVVAGVAAVPAASAVQRSAATGLPAASSQQLIELARRPAGSAGGAPAEVGPRELQQAVCRALRKLAERVEGSAQLLEVVSAAVSQLRSPAPVSTAALQCCEAAAEAVERPASKAQKAGSSAAALTIFPRELLHHLAAIMATWEAPQRLLAHRLFLQLLPVSARGLKQAQAHVLLSALWHEACMPSNPPAVFVAIDRSLAAAVRASPAASALEACHMVAALQAAVAGREDGGGKLAALPSLGGVAALLLCGSALQLLAAQLKQPQLAELAVKGSEGVLSCLVLKPGSGLELSTTATSASESSCSSSADGFLGSVAAACAFGEEDEARAARFLASWRAATSQQQEQSRFAAALAIVPAFAALPAGQLSAAFDPLPAVSLAPRVKGSGVYAGGAADSSTTAEESQFARRVRQLYHSLSTSREPETPAAGVLGSIPKDQGNDAAEAEWESQEADGNMEEEGLNTVDDVLAEVDAALGVAEAQLAGRLTQPASPVAAARKRGLGAAWP